MTKSNIVIARLSGYDKDNSAAYGSRDKIRAWNEAIDRTQQAGSLVSGEAVIATYVNSNQTKVLVGLFSDVSAAEASIKGQGVMGYGDGDMELLRVFKTEHAFAMTLPNDDKRKQVALANDEEYQMFLRLRDRFGA